MKIFNNIHEAYLGVLRDIYHNYDYKSAPRGQPIREKVDYVFKILEPVCEPIITKDAARNSVMASYMKKEIDLYNSCSNDVKDFEKASKFWGQLANPDGTINSAYGYLIWKNKSHGHPEFEGIMRTPWDWCLESLKKDKDTRQAILRFSLPEHQYLGNKDQTCTLSGNFLIREDKLHLTIVMRSSDMYFGIPYDTVWFISLMDKMVEDLKPTYPDLEKGHYTFMAHSLHCYDRNEAMILKMLGE